MGETAVVQLSEVRTASRMALLVKYIIPEDGDEVQHPNVFSMQGSSSSVTLGTIKRSFPLPGSYHFRFLHSSGGEKVWLDVSEDGASVPSGHDGIFAKISRIANSNGNGIAPINTQTPAPQGDKSARTSERLINFDSDGGLSPVANKREASVPTAASYSMPTSSSAPSILSSASDDLIGFNAAIETAATSSRNSSNVDLFGLESLQPVLAPLPPQQQQQQQGGMARPAMSAMGGLVRPPPQNGGGFGDPFSGLGSTTGPRGPVPANPYQQPRAPNRPGI